MQLLRIYGDSYAAPRIGCWANILANKLKIPEINKAVEGSSTEYAIKCFFQDLFSDNIGYNDIIIFVTSTPGRLHFEFQNQNPGSAVQYLRAASKEDHWYWENKDHLEWYLVNQDMNLNSINHESYIKFIKDVAWNRPDNLFIILSNSNSRIDTTRLDKINPPNFLRSYTYLNTVSENEIIDADLHNVYQDFVSYTGHDPRSNHLSVPNLEILSELLYYSIKRLTVSNITYEKFKTQILKKIRKKQDWVEGIDQGLYYYLDWYDKIISGQG
jgi:hypothetical protein